MEHTHFAGLTALDEGDPITVDGASFLIKNPRITDHLLQVGAVTHRHDQHPALANPHVALTGQVIASAGNLAASSQFALTYTVVDPLGGETTAAPPLVLQTSGQVAPPTVKPAGQVVNSAGIMPAGDYYYALTYTDGAGGETTIGPTSLVTVAPGLPSASVVLSGLAAELSPIGRAVNWRLWRSYEGADWHLVTQGSANVFTDSGFDPPDNPARPPNANTTASKYSLAVTIPAATADAALASGVSINVYLAPDTSFSEPCFYKQFPIASAGTTFLITSETIAEGSPPAVSTSTPGASRIYGPTEVTGWRTLVASGLSVASGGSALAGSANAQGELVFAGSGGASVTVRDLGGGSALVTVNAPTGVGVAGSGVTSLVDPVSYMEFTASGGASVGVIPLGGGSARIAISAPSGAQGPAGPPGAGGGTSVGVGGTGGVPLVDPASYIEFVASGGSSVGVIPLGGGSARISITAGGQGGGGGLAGIAVAASGGANEILPDTYIEFTGSGGQGVAVQSLGGGSARILIGPPVDESYENAVLSTPGLRYYWPMQDSGPSLAALMGRPAGVNAAAVMGAGGPPVVGAGLAAAFNGTSQFGSAIVDFAGAKAITVECWFLWNAFANNDSLLMELTANYSANQGFIIDPNESTSTKFQVGVHDAGGFNSLEVARPTALVWHHLVVQIDKNPTDVKQAIRIWIDDVEQAGTKTVGTADTLGSFPDSTLYLASRAGSALFGQCSLAHLAIYDRLIGPTYVAEHWAARQIA